MASAQLQKKDAVAVFFEMYRVFVLTLSYNSIDASLYNSIERQIIELFIQLSITYDLKAHQKFHMESYTNLCPNSYLMF